MKYICLSIFVGAVFLISLQDGATAHTKTAAAGRNVDEDHWRLGAEDHRRKIRRPGPGQRETTASQCAHCQVDDDTPAGLCEIGSYRALYDKILQHQLHRDTSYWPGSIDISAIDSDYDC